LNRRGSGGCSTKWVVAVRARAAKVAVVRVVAETVEVDSRVAMEGSEEATMEVLREDTVVKVD
jgi:hypothetical protein